MRQRCSECFRSGIPHGRSCLPAAHERSNFVHGRVRTCAIHENPAVPKEKVPYILPVKLHMFSNHTSAIELNRESATEHCDVQFLVHVNDVKAALFESATASAVPTRAVGPSARNFARGEIHKVKHPNQDCKLDVFETYCQSNPSGASHHRVPLPVHRMGSGLGTRRR